MTPPGRAMKTDADRAELGSAIRRALLLRARRAKHKAQLAQPVKIRSGMRAGQQIPAGAHAHTCVTSGCDVRYTCHNACDPRGLRDSLCPKCFVEAQNA